MMKRSTSPASLWDAIGFGMGDLPVSPGSRVEALYTPVINLWKGTASLQLRVRDLKTE